ncbi:glycerate kinase type-2 family protein [Planctomicrobium sp. SH661]|uniref:glycerate kinase type-2 family protein n=1 Tax=Planctomicrobium sp. SH661 TaxID=3448124 RepID=UPI003F5B820D
MPTPSTSSDGAADSDSGRQGSPSVPRPSLLQDALDIWKAGVAAVDSARLVQRSVFSWNGGISLAGTTWLPREESRIVVVGAGKAGSGMAAGLEDVLGDRWLPRTTGWVNVPEDCVRSLKRIHLHGARPAGVNEPTEAGVAGTREILQLVQELRPDDLCIVLISGGGSALLPAPVPGVSLEDKQKITRALMRRGATIGELNCVRRCLSAIKGGGLLRACGGGLVVGIIISDVIGDPLETIASGPTVSIDTSPHQAMEILKRYFTSDLADVPESVVRALEERQLRNSAPGSTCRVVNKVIGNNQTAVDAAATAARQRGYAIAVREWDQPGEAASAGRTFAARMTAHESGSAGVPSCYISGGETTVRLAQTSGEQKGGRNQEFALAACVEWLPAESVNVALVSGGTDGEDGPTDAAGAFVDSDLLNRVRTSQVDPNDYLRVNNSYRFFEQFGGLLKTGPTHTNVMDLRVGLLKR